MKCCEVAQRGFTLIELMVVVIIIAALVGIVLPHVLPATTEAKVAAARASIQSIQVGLDLFRLHNDRYPTTAEGLDALMKAPGSVNNWKGPYLRKDPIDPWKHKFRYGYPGTRSKTGCDIWSQGPDGNDGNEDDVWPE